MPTYNNPTSGAPGGDQSAFSRTSDGRTQSYRFERGPAHAENGVVVDLSEYADQIVNYDDISHLLTADQERRLVDYIKSMTDMSHSRISRRYPHWREADRAHDVYVPADTTNFREKAVIADTRAVADTVLTYLMSALSGRNPMFQLEGLNRKSRRSSLILERILHQQMRRTAGEARLAQLLLDSVRYGFAPTKVTWDARANQNRLTNFDPRRVFPDPRISWGDWEDMQFIVFSDFSSYSALVKTGLYPKLKMFPALRERQSPPRNGWQAHTWQQEEGRGLSIDPATPAGRERADHAFFTLGHARVVDEAWVCLSGYEIGIPQIDHLYMVITILDEDVVIRCQLNPYGRQFPVVIGGLHQDAHKTFGQSLYDLILPMHDIATYLLRSRIDNITAALNNLIFADPTQVSIPDLIDRNPWGIVRTMPGTSPGDGVFIAEVPDVTRGHIGDIAAMSDLKQRVSAASDAQQGMPTSDGIRTATEIQRLTQLGSQRLGVLSRIMSATTIRPMVRMMVSNIQDSLSFEGSVRMEDQNPPPALQNAIQDGYIDFDVLNDLQGDIDYLVIDGTLPVEPTRNAETWVNMLQVMSQTGLTMEYNAGQVAEEAIRAMGVTDIERFRVSEQQMREQGPSPSQQAQLMEMMRGASVRPEGEVQQQAERGNLVPISEARRA